MTEDAHNYQAESDIALVASAAGMSLGALAVTAVSLFVGDYTPVLGVGFAASFAVLAEYRKRSLQVGIDRDEEVSVS